MDGYDSYNCNRCCILIEDFDLFTHGEMMESDKAGHFDIAEVGGGITAEFRAGLSGITLGVLALLGIQPVTLMAIALIVYGSALIMIVEPHQTQLSLSC